MLSMRVVARDRGPEQRAAFVMGDEGFRIRLGEGRCALSCHHDPQEDLRFCGTANGLAALVYGKASVAQAVQRGPGRITGDPQAARAVIDRFHLPD